MTMGVSFKVSKRGVRFRPKPKPDLSAVLQDEDTDVPIEIHNSQIVISTPKTSVDVAENGKDASEISDADISFFINLLPDGYSVGNPSENRVAVQDDPKFLHPYDRTSESLFLAIERGLLPADFLDDIPCKYINGAVACEVRDYRNCASKPDSSCPITTKIRLKMSLHNVVKDIPLISDTFWTYGDLMEAEARILIALNPKLNIDPTPNLERLCTPPPCTNLNLNIRELRRKRLRQMARPDNSVHAKKICMDPATENDSSLGLKFQPSYQIGPIQDMTSSYSNGLNSNLGKRENQDGQLSPFTGLTKRSRSNSMGLDGSQQQQSVGRGIQVPYSPGTQKFPFEGSFNQDLFTTGQTGTRFNIKQEPVDSDVDMRLQQQQRLTQQLTRSNFPPTPWNTPDNSRKKPAQSPRVSSGAVPQSPLSSKSGEFSSGSHGGQYGAPAPMGSSQRDKSVATSVPTLGGPGSLTSNSQMAVRRSNSPASVGNIIGKEVDKRTRDKFLKIEMLTARYQLNIKKNKVDEYITATTFSTEHLNHHLFNDINNENSKDEPCKMPLSKSLVGGSMNVCKTRVLNLVQTERVLQGHGFSLVPKSRTRMILSEKQNDGTVAMHYGELDDCDYLASEEQLPTLPNTHVADLLAAQFCTLMLREGYHVEGDHLQPKQTNTVGSSSDQQNNNASGVLSPNTEMSETVSSQPFNERPSHSGTSITSSGERLYSPANSLPLGGGGRLLPPSRPLQAESQQPFQQNQHNLMQQQLQGSLSHLNAIGLNSNMQQFGHMLNRASPMQLQMLQQQQQQRKMMTGFGNVGMGNPMRGTRGISTPMTGVLSGMGNNVGQGPISMNQASSLNAIGQQLRSGLITPAEAHIMATKLRMAQSRAMLGGTGGQSGSISGLPGANRPVHPGSTSYSLLSSGMNRANNMNPMQRTAMAPPKLVSGMNAYMNQQQQQMPHQQQQLESTSPLQAVLSPPQQIGSPSMGLPQQLQASPQQMSQRTPMSPQLSSGAIHPTLGAGNQDVNCPASPQLSSQTMGSVNSKANSPMDMQGVNKSS